jgi:hypothetical protein
LPFPLVAHQGVGAPFLVADRKARLDAVAFLFGTVAPDLPYALDRSRFDFDVVGHQWIGLVVWCVPAVVALTWLFRSFVARPLAAHLPDLGPFRLRDVGGAADDYPSLLTVVVSAVLGTATHLLADGFTHPEAWLTRFLPVLDQEAPIDLPSYISRPTYWYDVCYWIADIAGVVLAIVCLYLVGRRNQRAGRPRPDVPAATATSRPLFWGPVIAGAGVGLLLAIEVWGIETIAQASMLFAWSVAIGVFVGSLLVERIWATSPEASRPA